MTKAPPMPAEVQVGPHTYRVLPDPDGLLEGASRCGQCSTARLVIVVATDMPHTTQADTLLHELIHAALAPLADALEKLGPDLEELVAATVAPALLDALRANPDLVAWLTA